MCRPVIVQSGYSDGLALFCREHDTTEPVMNSEGDQTYTVDVLQHLDMLVAHRTKYEGPNPTTWEAWAKNLSDKILKTEGDSP